MPGLRLLPLLLLCALAAGCGGRGNGGGADRSGDADPVKVWITETPMASAHVYARRRILTADAAQDVVRDLGEDTFSARALSLLTSEGRVTAVPTDGWGQLLI